MVFLNEVYQDHKATGNDHLLGALDVLGMVTKKKNPRLCFW